MVCIQLCAGNGGGNVGGGGGTVGTVSSGYQGGTGEINNAFPQADGGVSSCWFMDCLCSYKSVWECMKHV